MADTVPRPHNSRNLSKESGQRILVLFGNVPLFGNERANIETIRQLRDRGAEVLFLIRSDYTDNSIQPELRRLNLQYKFCPYYDTIRFGVGAKVWLKNISAIITGSMLLLYLAVTWRPTHFHLGSTAWTINFLPALMMTRIPLVFRAGDIPPQHHALWRWMWAYTVRRASAFVCDSEYVKREIVGMGAPPDRCEVVYAPAPVRPASRPEATSTQSESSSTLTVLYVGQISEEKGVGFLVEAAESLVHRHDVRFVIAGDYSWRNKFGESLVEQISRKGMSDRIIFTGFMTDIEPLYSGAQLHVAPSLCTEAYGLTVVEAKLRSIPSIVFPSGGLPELVQHGVEGWVCQAPTADALREAIEQYLVNPSLIAEHGARAYASLAERLEVHRFGERWAAIYDRTSRH